MKLGPVAKLDKSKKNLTLTSCREIVTSLSFFRFMANLQPSTFSLTLTCHVTKTENRIKKSLR